MKLLSFALIIAVLLAFGGYPLPSPAQEANCTFCSVDSDGTHYAFEQRNQHCRYCGLYINTMSYMTVYSRPYPCVVIRTVAVYSGVCGSDYCI